MALRVIARSAICVIYLEEGWVRIVQRDMLAIYQKLRLSTNPLKAIAGKEY